MEQFLNTVRKSCFDDVFHMHTDDVVQINTQDAMYLRRGDVVMVRSSRVPELGDHFILVTGRAIQKQHGFRPQTVAMPASKRKYSLLDLFDEYNGVVALKLKDNVKEAFYKHYGISINNEEGMLIIPVLETHPVDVEAETNMKIAI